MRRFALIVCAVLLAWAAMADDNGERPLSVLDEFAIPYDDVAGADYDTPVMSMSQRFTDLEADMWVETAVPLEVPDEMQWDLRAMRFDVAIGRRRVGSDAVFSFDWDGERVLRDFGGRLNVYASCDSSTHSTGKPCPNPVATYAAQLLDQSLETATEGAWGRAYRADVFLSRDPSEEGFVTHERIWVSFFATMPSRYTDEADGNEYELRHWFPVWSSASETTDLAIADHADLLERGWTDWRHGQELKNSLYQGVSHPSPGFSAIGYETRRTRNAPSPTALVNGTHHWPSGIPPVSKNADSNAGDDGGLSGTDIAIIISVTSGIIVLVCVVLFLIINGLIRRRRRNLEAKETSKTLLRRMSDDQTSLMLDDDGAFARPNGSFPGKRSVTSTSTGSPMFDRDGTGDENNPYSGKQPRGRISRFDDSSDDFES